MLLKVTSTQIKQNTSWEASINIKKNFFLIHLHSSTIVYIRLEPSSSPLVYIRLESRLV